MCVRVRLGGLGGGGRERTAACRGGLVPALAGVIPFRARFATFMVIGIDVCQEIMFPSRYFHCGGRPRLLLDSVWLRVVVSKPHAH